MPISLEFFCSFIKNRYIWFFCFISILLGYSFPYQSNSLIFSFFGYLFGFLGIIIFSLLGYEQKKGSLSLFLFLGFYIQTLVRLQWALSHPYLYIVPIWIFLSALLSFPISALFRMWIKSSLQNRFPLLSAAFFSSLLATYELLLISLPFGISFYTASLLFAADSYRIQFISLIGICGGSFWIFFTACIGTLFWQKREKRRFLYLFLWSLLLFIPYGYGFYRLDSNQKRVNPVEVSIALCHMEESPDIFEQQRINPFEFTAQEWNKVLMLLKPLLDGKKKSDLIAIPEGAIPYSAHALLINRSALSEQIEGIPLLASSFEVAQKISSITKSPLLLGIEGRDSTGSFNSAFFIKNSQSMRYDKQILLPFGEYIPFSCLSRLLQNYGVHGSFLRGESNKLFSISPHGKQLLFAPLICYEETFPYYGRKAKEAGASFIVSISNDAWFPSPQLKRAHFDLARLHAVEIGMPFFRSTNQGISGVITSLGESILSHEGSATLLISSITIEERPKETGFMAMRKKISHGVQVGFFALQALGIVWFFKRERFSFTPDFPPVRKKL